MFAVEEQKRLQMIEVLTSGSGMHWDRAQPRERNVWNPKAPLILRFFFKFYKRKNLAQWYLGRNDV